MEFPSTKALTICDCSALLKLFIVTIMLEQKKGVKGKSEAYVKKVEAHAVKLWVEGIKL
jgi:hypothetical protein